MTQNIWYTVARTSDSECTGRVLFSIGNSSLSFDVFIQFGNISISIVSAVVEADTVFSIRVRSHAGFYYVDVKSSREYSSSPSFSVDQILGTLTPVTFGIAGDGRQECIVSTDAWAPSPSGETYVTTDTIQAITALKYFEDGLAIGDQDAYWVLSYGSGGVFINGNRILVTSDLNNYATQSWVLGKNYITASALTGYVNGGAYNSNTKNIELKHDSTVVAQIDATAFIKDGMVDTVVVENGYLVITFNTDSGKEPISIPLADLFDPTNYYTKSDINSMLGNYVTLNTSQTITAEKYFSSALAIPTSAPVNPTSGRTYLYSGSGNYAEVPGGGVADVYDLTLKKGNTTLGLYQPGVEAKTIDIASAFSGYATESWVSANFNKYVLPTASSSTKGGVKIGSGLTMTGEVLSVTFPTVSWDNISGRPTKLSDFTDDVVSGNYLPIHGTADAALRLSGNTAYTAWGQTYWSNGVPQSISGNISSAGNITGSGLITMPSAKFSSSLIIPHAAPTGTLESGETYLYAGSGDYAEESSGGGVSDIYPLTITKNGSAWLSYDPATEATSANLSIGWSDLTPDASHRFLTDSLISTWNAKYDKPSGGIPATDLASAVQTSLGKADTALQNFTETDPTVPSWAKASTKPTYSLSEITGTDDLQAIEALSGTSGFLKKTAANTWGLDTHTYLTADDHKALTLKVGTTTVQADYNALAAKTYTISKQNLTDTIGNTTYAVYNADGYVPTTRKVNGHALSSDVTVTKGDVGLGNVENTALSTWAGTSNITTLGTITTGTWNGTAIANAYLANSSVTINGKSVSLGGSVSLNLDDIGDGTTKTWSRIVFTDTDQTITGTKKLKSVSLLNIPTSAPASADIESGKIYLYSSAGEYSETPSGSGTGDIYSLTVTKNGSPWLSYEPSSAAVSTNLTIGWSDLTEDSTHKFVSQTEKDTWNAKLDSVPLATSSVIGGFLYGDPEDTMLVMQNGFLSLDLLKYLTTTQGIIEGYGYTQKTQAIPYIVGPDTDTTAGTWTGTYTGITSLTEGLTIVYVPHVAGATTTTLNINGLGAKTCYYSGTSKLTTHYPVGTPILFTYYNNGWRRADYNSNTTYSAGTKALFDAGTNTSNRVWSASVLASAVAPIVHEHDWTDINNAPAFITADALDGYATETYVGNQIAALNLGTASQKDYTTSVAQNGTDLPTSGAVYSAIAAAVTSALHYRGISSVALTDGGTETAVIGGESLVAQAGDVVIYNGFEFLWENSKWNKLGDDTSYALKTITISAGTGLTGGGDLTAARTISLSTSTQTDIGKGVTAYGWGNHSSQGYLKSSDHKALTLKVGTATVQSDYTSLAAKTYTITKQHITDAIGNTTYAAYNANGYLPLSGGTLSGALTITAGGLAVQGGDLTAENNIWAVGNITAEGKIAAWGALAIPTTAPSAGLIESGEVYLWASSLGEYSETPGGGGTGDIYALTITKNGSAWLSYNPGVASVSANLTIGWSDLTPDANHRFLTDTLISTWNGKQDAISDLSTIRTNAGHGNTAYGWGDHSQAGYLTSYTETDPVFSASAAAGITSSNISTWNGKYAKPSAGIPKTDLANAVQTSLGLADTALQSVPLATDSTIGGFKTGNVNQTYLYFDNNILKVSDSAIADYLSGEGYFDLPTWQDIQNTPTTLSGYGITDAKIANGTITLGSNSITPLTSFTETDPTVPSWAKASTKPSYGLNEITGTDDLKAIEALTGTGLAKRTADNTWELTDTADKAGELVTSTEEDAMFTYRQVPSEAVGDVCKITSVKGKSIVNAGELVNNAASGVEMLDAGGNSLGTIPLNITGLTSNGVQIFPDGMKSAGTAYDEWSGTTATKRIGVVDLGTLAWSSYGSSGDLFVTNSLVLTGLQNILTTAYQTFNGTTLPTQGYISNRAQYGKNSLWVRDSTYTSAAAFKAAMSGVLLYYELATPETYTTDQPLPDTLVPFESGGTMRRLPVDTTSEVIAPMVCDFQYGANMSDVAKAYLPLAGGTLTGDLTMSSGTTLDTDAAKLAIPTAAPSSPTSGKIYLYASSTGSYAVEPWYGFNQLISNGNMESTTGWGTVYSGYTRTVENNVLTLTITSATYRPQTRTALSVANGHWVYYTYTMKYTTSAAYSDVKTAFLYPTPQYIPTGNQKDADYYDWKKTSGIVKVNAAKTYLYIGRTAASSHTFAVGDTVQIKNVMVCDLTEMFGDNIPTVEQFEAMYPQDYYDYSPIE